MKVVILGDGTLGAELVKQSGWDYYSRKKDNLDITQFRTWPPAVLGDYDTVINCMAYTETYSPDKERNWEVNVVAVEQLAEYCNLEHKKLIHISTDYLYAGSVPNASEEDVPVHLPTWYGYTKLVGDAIVQLRCKDYLICRLSHKPTPFPYLEAWTDLSTNCDYVDVVARLVLNLIKQNCQGIYNVGTQSKTIFDLAKRTNPKVQPITKPEKAPADTTMNLLKLSNTV
jgi:dTDP-4-dehydrorhamnose reductase